MVEKRLKDFSLEQICRSGQCFRMSRREDGLYQIIAGDRYLLAQQEEDLCRFYSSQEEYDTFWKSYFDLEKDYGEYKNTVGIRDKYLQEAVQLAGGVRILRQDLWEMIVSFLISSQNNITRIRRCIDNICREYGEEKRAQDGTTYYAFPKAEALACLAEDQLKECNLGYRSKYVVRTAKMVCQGEISLEKIKGMSYKKAKEELLKCYGVGEKVADCICLFGLHQLQAFPVDTHIRQALEGHYPKGFPKRRYKGFEGVMQQYIFYYELYGKK